MPDEARHLPQERQAPLLGPTSARALIVEDLASLPATVLVIDDDPAMVESLALMLEGHGFRVLTANNGIRGLQVFREQGPAAVLTDIVMPEQDGIGAIMEMRRERPDAKIIAMSGCGRVGKTDFLTIARKLGANATFEKGRGANELVVMLEAMLRR